jgi:hypothetical protein
MNTKFFWDGKWERDIWKNNSNLEISLLNKDSISFELMAINGGNTGGLSGIAVLNGDLATFLSIESNDTCKMTLKLSSDTLIEINQLKGNCYAGLGVEYSGKYFKLKKSQSLKKAPTLRELGVFETQDQDNNFKKMVGSDYLLFVESNQIEGDDIDLDSLNMVVKSNGIRGMYSFMQNIIMYDSKNNFIAAVIDDNKVLYFTNTVKFKKKLPNTIEKWREDFKDLNVVFK